MALPLAVALPAAASVVGGVMSYIGQKDANAQNKDIANKQLKAQQEAAQQGLGWRIKDAVAHGLSPLVGAGASSTSISPTAIGMENELGGVGHAVSSLGQNLGNAMSRNQPKSVNAMTEKLSALALERAGLQNELLRSQITSINNSGAGSPGAQSVSVTPSEQTASMKNDPSMEASQGTPAWKLFDSSPTGKMILPSEKMKQAIEDSPYETQLFISDYLQKLSGSKGMPGRTFNPLTGEHTPRGDLSNWMAEKFRNYFLNREKASHNPRIRAKY